jgi:hypothetical protein
MTGMTNRPEHVEEENQQRVEAQKDHLPDFEQVNRPRQDHPMDRDQEFPPEESDRMNETGAGRGWDHQGH